MGQRPEPVDDLSVGGAFVPVDLAQTVKIGLVVDVALARHGGQGVIARQQVGQMGFQHPELFFEDAVVDIL